MTDSVNESGEGMTKQEKVREMMKLVQVFMSDLLKPRDKRTLSPEETAQARNYVIMLLLGGVLVYYVGLILKTTFSVYLQTYKP